MESNSIKSLLFFVAISTLIFYGCCDKIATFNLTTNPSFEQSIQMKRGEIITFWSDIEVEFKEQPLIVYSFKFYEKDLLLFEGGVDPLKASPKEEFNIEKQNDKTIIKLKGKLEGNFKAKKDGIYAIKVQLIHNKTSTLQIQKAKVTFFKQ